MLKNQKGDTVVIIVVILFIVGLAGVTFWVVNNSKSRSGQILQEQPKTPANNTKQS